MVFFPDWKRINIQKNVPVHGGEMTHVGYDAAMVSVYFGAVDARRRARRRTLPYFKCPVTPQMRCPVNACKKTSWMDTSWCQINKLPA